MLQEIGDRGIRIKNADLIPLISISLMANPASYTHVESVGIGVDRSNGTVIRPPGQGRRRLDYILHIAMFPSSLAAK